MKQSLLTTAIALSLLFPLYGYAEEDASSTPTTPIKVSSSSEETVIEETAVSPDTNFTLCSQEAIEDRDTKIATSRSLYNTAMANALNERKNKEKAAVAITNENKKKTAIKASVDLYKNLVKTAQNNLTSERKIAWQEFEQDLEKCREIQDTEQKTQNSAPSEAVSEEGDKKEISRAFQMEAPVKKEDDEGTKMIKETIKAGIESLRSLFN